MYRFLSIILLTISSLNCLAQTPQDSTVTTTPKKADIQAVQEGSSSESLLKQADALYSKGHYPNAAATYEQVIAQYGLSAELYYNLGNAYYKSERLAPAILNYERALRLKPSDRDARFNLEMCQARIVDKINPMGMFLITRWYEALGNCFNSNFWAGMSIGLFLIFIACLFAYFFARIGWLKKVGFFCGMIILMLSVLSMVYSGRQAYRMNHPDEAILFTLSVTVKSSPDKSGTDLFVLHEGTKMKVLSTLGTWSEIELEDGNIGWLESKHIEII
jgi:tetratricopeptide (TPR) repeat protein